MRKTWLAFGICMVSVVMGAAVCKHFEWHVPLPARKTKPLDHVPTPETKKKWHDYNQAITLRQYDLICKNVTTKDVDLDTLILPVAPPEFLQPTVDLQPEIPPPALVAVNGGGDVPLFLQSRPVAYAPPPAPAVPEPATIWLLLTGILGMGLILKNSIPSFPQAAK